MHGVRAGGAEGGVEIRTPAGSYKPVILQILCEAGGSASRKKVISEIPFRLCLTQDDYDIRLNTQPVWEYLVDSMKQQMVRQLLIERRQKSGWGIWQLTDLGLRKCP